MLPCKLTIHASEQQHTETSTRVVSAAKTMTAVAFSPAVLNRAAKVLDK
jgi:hypothetical protein